MILYVDALYESIKIQPPVYFSPLQRIAKSPNSQLRILNTLDPFLTTIDRKILFWYFAKNRKLAENVIKQASKVVTHIWTFTH